LIVAFADFVIANYSSNPYSIRLNVDELIVEGPLVVEKGNNAFYNNEGKVMFTGK